MGRTVTLTRVGAALTACAALALLSGCSTGASAGAPSWVPSPSYTGEGGNPNGHLPTPAVPQPSPNRTGPNAPRSSTPGPSTSSTVDPFVVATKLHAPDAIALLPDTTALVGERTTGRIVRVQPVPGQPVQTVRTLPGVASTGDGGLLSLAVSPSFAQDNLVFAYLTTATDNRIVEFTLAGAVTPVLTGIPRGSSGNGGQLMFGPDGYLYVATGDAGSAQLAANPASLAGKVLRLTTTGGPAPGNPGGSRVYVSNQADRLGLCDVDQDGTLLATDLGSASGRGPVQAIRPGQRHTFGTLPAGAIHPGGCAADGSALYVTSLDGQAFVQTIVNGQAGTLGPFATNLAKKYGRLLTIAVADDGTLWLTTSNRDGHGTPVPADERVLHIPAPNNGDTTFPG